MKIAKKLTSVLASSVLAFSLLSLFVISNSVNANAQISPENNSQMLAEINKNRLGNSLKPLASNEKLDTIANSYAENLAQNNRLSHTGLDGQNVDGRMTKFGYNWTAFGENIAAGSDSPVFTVGRWMNSNGHKANILNSDFCEVGIGYGSNQNSDYKHYWVLNFGCREDFDSNSSEQINSSPIQTQNTQENQKIEAVQEQKEEQKAIPAIRAHYPYNPTTQLINPSTEKTDSSANSKVNSQNFEQKTVAKNPTKIKVSNFQTCKNAGGELSDFVYNSQTLVKCSISGHHFASMLR